MTTTDLGSIMSARRAELEGTPPPDAGGVEVIPPADQQTGEIVPVTAGAGDSGGGGGSTPAPAATPAVPAEPAAAGAPAFPAIPPKVLGGLPYAPNYMRLAKTIHNTEMVPRAFRGKPDALMAAFMYGYEVGLGPMQAANGINVIDGSAGLDAETMRALILEEGHIFVLQQGRNTESGEAWATVFCRRKDWPDEIPTAQFTWTSERGARAGLLEWHEKWITTERGGKRKLTWNPHGDEPEPEWVHPDGKASAELKRSSAWTNYPEAMCGARATSEAARANFADVVKGLSYTPEEIREFDGGQTELPAPQEVPPSPVPTTASPSDSTLDADGPPAEATPPAPAATAPPSAEPPPAKKPRAKKAPAPMTGEPSTDPSPSATETAPSTTTEETSPPPSPSSTSQTVSESSSVVQPNLEGQTPPPEPELDPGEAGVIVQLARSLRTLLEAKTTADRQLITAFLGRHFPGRRAEELTPDELTKAINIVAGWPGSADTYPAPDPDPVD